MQANPALPWAADSGGTITLKTPISVTQLRAGAVIFELELNGTPVRQSSISFRYGSDNLGHILVDDEQKFSVYMYPENGPFNVLAINPLPGVNDYSVKNVRLANIRYQIEIFKDQACTQKPTRGDLLQIVYVKFSDDFDDTANFSHYNAQNPWDSFNFVPASSSSEAVVNPYIRFNVDGISEGDPVSGQVFEAIANNEYTIDQPITTGFSPVYEP